MKIGRQPERDVERVRVARAAVGDQAKLFVDANGAYSRKEALAFAHAFAELGVSWFEEPVSSDDLEGLRLLRDRAPEGMDIAAGEYGYDLPFSVTCWRRVPLMSYRLTRRVAPAFLSSLESEHYALHVQCHSRLILHPICTLTLVARWLRYGISNTFMITNASNTCCSMAH